MKTTEPLSGMPSSLEGKAAMMERVLAAAGIAVLFQDATLAIQYADNLPEFLQNAFRPGQKDGQLFGSRHQDYLSGLKKQVLETGAPATAEIEIETPDENRVYELKIERVSAPDGLGILSVMSEVTETRHRERVLKSLLRELSHRSKNLLAIIQGIATQTARHTLSLDNFLIKFRGRLQSLSNSQDLITDSSWRGAFLFELAEKQFAPYWPDVGSPMPITGINAHLSPNAAVHLGLALHELIVNSASHGTIAAGGSEITLTCKPAELNGRKAVEVTWTECLPEGRNLHEFEENSFGRTVLERVVPTSMNGRAVFKIEPDRVLYNLLIPETEYEMLKTP